MDCREFLMWCLDVSKKGEWSLVQCLAYSSSRTGWSTMVSAAVDRYVNLLRQRQVCARHHSVVAERQRIKNKRGRWEDIDKAKKYLKAAKKGEKCQSLFQAIFYGTTHIQNKNKTSKGTFQNNFFSSPPPKKNDRTKEN